MSSTQIDKMNDSVAIKLSQNLEMIDTLTTIEKGNVLRWYLKARRNSLDEVGKEEWEANS